MKIAVCPGHHSARPGARNEAHGLVEHDEVLRIVAHVVNIFADWDDEVRAFTGTLKQKVEAINAWEADVALDVHLNASPGHDTSGCMSLHYPNRAGRRLSQYISQQCSTLLALPDLGARIGNYQLDPKNGIIYFLSRTNMTAAVVEPLYVDHPTDVLHLLAKNYALIAFGVCDGVRRYLAL